MATTNYPGSLDAYPVPNNGDTISVADHWLGPAVIGIETELGTDPAGTFTDVKSRLDSGLTTEVDMWKLTSTFTSSGLIDITGVSRTWSDYKGSGMSQSSGVFTFPSTGYWLINYNTHALTQTAGSNYVGGYCYYSANSGSSYTQLTAQITAGRNASDYVSTSGIVYIPVLNASTYRVKFQVLATSSTQFVSPYTNMQFIKLGDL
jgi:hypothetical protein